MAISFIQAKSTADDIIIERESNLNKMADVIAKYMASKVSRQPSNASITEIDKLLSGFSSEEKYEIMKLAFVKVC